MLVYEFVLRLYIDWIDPYNRGSAPWLVMTVLVHRESTNHRDLIYVMSCSCFVTDLVD